jgi:hypothetical protein
MKKLSTLLSRRRALLRHARLANLAFAFATLQEFSGRIARASLCGRVTLTHAAPEAERYWASLLALTFNQSVVEEHFTDAQVMELADVLAFATGNDALDVTFNLEDLDERFLRPLREQLERAGIIIDRPTADAGSCSI